MSLFNWSDKYSVGVKEFDTQHKVLIDILNELYDAMKNNTSHEKLGIILTKLINYTKTHFASEEKYMAQYGYPQINEHKKEHAKFTEKVVSYKTDFDAKRTSMTVSITSFLKEWLATHILGSDAKYQEFFNAKGLR